jgi:hypothetical protein
MQNSNYKKVLTNFIREAKKRGFQDYEIRKPLLEKGWPEDEINSVFVSLNKGKSRTEKESCKDKVIIYLEPKVLTILQKRAKKNLFSLSEQVEDILRRSCMNKFNNKSNKNENLDDLLISIFSRKKK